MSGECEKCDEKISDCICNDPVLNSMANIIARNMRESQIKISLESIEKAGMLDEFNKFYEKNKRKKYVFDLMIEFCQLHKDKFYVAEKNESYSKFIIID